MIPPSRFFIQSSGESFCYYGKQCKPKLTFLYFPEQPSFLTFEKNFEILRNRTKKFQKCDFGVPIDKFRPLQAYLKTATKPTFSCSYWKKGLNSSIFLLWGTKKIFSCSFMSPCKVKKNLELESVFWSQNRTIHGPRKVYRSKLCNLNKFIWIIESHFKNSNNQKIRWKWHLHVSQIRAKNLAWTSDHQLSDEVPSVFVRFLFVAA